MVTFLLSAVMTAIVSFSFGFLIILYIIFSSDLPFFDRVLSFFAGLFFTLLATPILIIYLVVGILLGSFIGFFAGYLLLVLKLYKQLEVDEEL